MKYYMLTLFVSLLIFSSCDDPLQEETFSTLSPQNYYNSAEDAEVLLNGVYAPLHRRDILRDILTFGSMTTDEMIERGGAINSFIGPVQNFEWTSTNPRLNVLWGQYYRAITRANLVIDRVPDIDMDEERKKQIVTEARFLRALHYKFLYNLFGPVPLITSSEVTAEDRPERATGDEIVNFIIDEFEAVSNILPATQQEYGRATRGAALGFLTKFHLNNKEWNKAAEKAKEIIDNNQYSLVQNGNRTSLFDIDNQINSEFMFVIEFPDGGSVENGDGMTYLSHAAPPGYKFEYKQIVNFAANISISSEFIDLFGKGDERRDAFIFKYENQAGDSVSLGENDVRSFKYPEDPNGTRSVTSSDVPLVRYADILLARAEALNELNGPSQESIDLINDVREAAGVDPITLAEYPGKQALRGFILDERGREFHTEGLRREDLIRQGEFIENARDRSLNAKEYQTLFPIPQSAIDRNPNLEQNNGYK